MPFGGDGAFTETNPNYTSVSSMGTVRDQGSVDAGGNSVLSAAIGALAGGFLGGPGGALLGGIVGFDDPFTSFSGFSTPDILNMVNNDDSARQAVFGDPQTKEQAKQYLYSNRNLGWSRMSRNAQRQYDLALKIATGDETATGASGRYIGTPVGKLKDFQIFDRGADFNVNAPGNNTGNNVVEQPNGSGSGVGTNTPTTPAIPGNISELRQDFQQNRIPGIFGLGNQPGEIRTDYVDQIISGQLGNARSAARTPEQFSRTSRSINDSSGQVNAQVDQVLRGILGTERQRLSDLVSRASDEDFISTRDNAISQARDFAGNFRDTAQQELSRTLPVSSFGTNPSIGGGSQFSLQNRQVSPIARLIANQDREVSNNRILGNRGAL